MCSDKAEQWSAWGIQLNPALLTYLMMGPRFDQLDAVVVLKSGGLASALSLRQSTAWWLSMWRGQPQPNWVNGDALRTAMLGACNRRGPPGQTSESAPGAWAVVAKSSVLRLIRQAGERVRHPRLSAADTAQLIALDEAGMAQKDIAGTAWQKPECGVALSTTDRTLEIGRGRQRGRPSYRPALTLRC
jgi:hypothetical protein